jgi:hypothetical protein
MPGVDFLPAGNREGFPKPIHRAALIQQPNPKKSLRAANSRQPSHARSASRRYLALNPFSIHAIALFSASRAD